MANKCLYDDTETYRLIKYLLYTYHNVKDSTVREKARCLIITKMMPIIKRIARTIARRSYDPIDDLVQAGSIGLLKAIDHYDQDKNENFKIYAGYLIIGEMKHYLRDLSYAIKVPRYVQELSYRINVFINSLTTEELKELTSEDVAEVLNIPAKAVELALQNDRRGKVISIETINVNQEDNLAFEEFFADPKAYNNSLNNSNLLLKTVIDKLPLKYKEIVEFYYCRGFTQKQISEMLGLSRMQVSRRVKKAFNLMCQLAQIPNFEPMVIEEDIDDIDEIEYIED